MKIHGISLAAGFGTRLMPLTAKLPKPLLPLLGKPILEITLEKLFDAGVEAVAVNTHYLGGMIEEHVRRLPYADKVHVFPEKEILGTGGPFVNAKEFLLDADLILLHNADIVCDFDIRPMIEKHVAESNIVTMALIDGPENRVTFANGKVRDILGKLSYPHGEQNRILTYACIAVFSPEIFEYLPEEPVFSSIVDAVLKALREKPESVGGYIPPSPFIWSDIGSFEQYFQAHKTALAKAREPFRFGEGCRIGETADFHGFVSAGRDCIIGENARLSNCILFDNAEISSGDYRAWEIIGKDFSFHRDIREVGALAIVSEFMPDIRVTSLAEQGSNRRFLRIRSEASPEQSKVLMFSSPEDLDFERFIEIGSFFNHHDLYTPQLYADDREHYAVLMEDLGDQTVWSLVSCSGDNDSEIEILYRKIIDASVDFQIRGTSDIEKAGFTIREFDYGYLRWETDYFMENFVSSFCGIMLPMEELNGLDTELHKLAAMNQVMPQMLMHRDFQSQNILLHNDKIRFVDYQGARIGPYAYDIMSLLKDPYTVLNDCLRCRLMEYHCRALNDSGFKVSAEEHRRDCAVSGLQRNMQCLGAYGFLALKKGKIKYFDYMEPCFNYLLGTFQDAKQFSSVHFPQLESLLSRIEGLLSKKLLSVKSVKRDV